MTPNSKLTRLVDATTEPLSLADAKNFLRVDIDDDDSLISDLITAARMDCERINNRSFITTTWKLTLDYFPPFSGSLLNLVIPGYLGNDRNCWVGLTDNCIQLPMPPLIMVSSIGYIDQSGTTQNLDLSNVVISPGTPGQIMPQYGKIFPFTLPVIGAVNITYTAGYGVDSSYVPKNVVTAIRYLTAHYYEHRTEQAEIPDAVRNLLDSTYWGSYV